MVTKIWAAAAQTQAREAQVQHSAKCLKYLHLQFRSVAGPGHMSRGDDEASRLFMRGETDDDVVPRRVAAS